MIKGVIFDLDNTLVNFMEMKLGAVDAAVDAMIDAGLQMGKKEAKEKIMDIYWDKGIEYQNVFDLFLKEQIGDLNYKILAAGIIGYRRARDGALVPYPHVRTTLMKLIKMGLKLGVVSDAPGKEAWLRLGYLRFHQIFDVVVTFEDTGLTKPAPEPFLKVLQRLEIMADKAIMVGDWAERDVIGAKKVGIRTVFARYGDTFNTKHSGADFDIDDISELIDIVEKENSP